MDPLLSLPFLFFLLTILTAALLYRLRPQANPASLLTLLINGDRILEWTTDLLSASPTHTVTTFLGVVTADPTNVEHVLRTRFDGYAPFHLTVAVLSDLMGAGIFLADGDNWKLQHRSASLKFAARSFRSFAADTARSLAAARLLPRLSDLASSGRPFNIEEILESFSFDNVAKVALGVDPADGGFDLPRAFEDAIALSFPRYRHPFNFTWKAARLLGLGRERRLREKLSSLHQFFTGLISARKSSSSGDDLLSRFIAEADYPDEFLRDFAVSFVIAGRDTTSAALTWFFWLVASHPAAKEKIREEIRQVRSTTNDLLSLEELREMHYLHAALSETMRLYPPVPLETRTCREGDVLPDGTVVGKGWGMMYNSYAMGRMESIWGKDCLEFRPERWLDRSGAFEPRSPFRYPIFHAGPRMCLGKDVAYIQMKTVAAAVLERFEVDVVEAEKERETEVGLVMKMRGGMMVKVREKLAAVVD